jgi:hypothetical protein
MGNGAKTTRWVRFSTFLPRQEADWTLMRAMGQAWGRVMIKQCETCCTMWKICESGQAPKIRMQGVSRLCAQNIIVIIPHVTLAGDV